MALHLWCCEKREKRSALRSASRKIFTQLALAIMYIGLYRTRALSYSNCRSHSPSQRLTVIPDRTINRLSFGRADIPNDADSRYSPVGKARLLILELERLERLESNGFSSEPASRQSQLVRPAIAIVDRKKADAPTGPEPMARSSNRGTQSRPANGSKQRDGDE